MEGFLDPEKVLNQLELRENMIAADFGCGSGGWVIPLAKRLKEGRVIAIDVLEEPLSALESKIQHQRISNIKTIRSDVENKNGSTLTSGLCDLVLMTNLLFQVEDKKLVLEEGKRVLRSGGKLLIVSWELNAPLGPKEGRVSAQDAKKIAEEAGLEFKKEFAAGGYHYGLVFEKP